MELTKLLKPGSIAVVGASEKEGFGGDVCRNILTYMHDLSRVYFVNPKRETVFEQKCFHSVAAIQDTIDLLIICTPQKTVLPILEEGAKKGCGGAVIFASGYGETGTEEGRENERELLQKAKELNIAIMGPNCAGYVNYSDNIRTLWLDHSCGSGRFRVKPKVRSQLLHCFMVTQIEQLCHKVDHVSLGSATEAEEIIFIQLQARMPVIVEWAASHTAAVDFQPIVLGSLLHADRRLDVFIDCHRKTSVHNSLESTKHPP